MPTLLQASISNDPAGAVIFFPSTVRFMSAMIFRSAGVSPAVRRASSPGAISNFNSRYNRNSGYPPDERTGEMPVLHQYRFAHFFKRARLAIQMIFKLFSEFLHERHGGHCCRVSERTECLAQHVFGEIVHIIDVLRYTPARMETNQSFLQPVRAFAARDTPAAALVPVELHRAQRKLDDASIVVEHHYTSGTKHRTRLRHRIKVHSDVDFFG